MKWNRISFLTLTPAFLILLGACQTEYSDGFKDRLVQSKEQDQKEWENFEKKLCPIPDDAINSVRIFATQNIAGLSDDEVDFINNNKPTIQYNELNMEYSFSWRFDKKEILEVVTSPPPCMPMAAYRTSRIYYP